MKVMQNYGVLRVVRGNHGSQGKIARSGFSMREDSTHRGQELVGEGFAPFASLQTLRKRTKLRHKYLSRWLPEERLVHILSQRETTIGRALSSDIILLDPTVSRDHARLVLGEHGWSVQNMTENNVVRVNNHIVAGGTWLPIQPQDLLIIGNTTLQLVAPLPDSDLLISRDSRSKEPSLQGVGMGLTPTQISMEISLVDPEWIMQAGASPAPTLFGEGEDGWGRTSSLQQLAFLRSGGRARRIFVIGGLLSIIIIAGVSLALSSLGRLSGLAQDGMYSLFLALIVPLIPALGINILVHFIDRYERASWFLRLAAFLWGAIIAIPPALFIENFIDGFVTHLWGLDSQVVLHAFLSGLDAGITEETVKGLGLLLLFFVLHDDFDNITDGIVYGALIGAGFAMVENFYYFLNNPNDLSALIVGRIVLGWLSHSTFTICFGAALGYIRHTRVRWRHIVVPLLGYLLAVGLHTIFDFVNIFVLDVVPTYGNSPTVGRIAILAVIGNYIPPFIVQVSMLYILIKSLTYEAEIIREFLASEVARGVITVDEYAMLPHSFARTSLERKVLWCHGVRQWLLARALYRAEIGLAFRKWHISMGDKPRSGNPQPEGVYRKRIKRIREELSF